VAINVERYSSSDSTIRLNQSHSDVHLPLRSESPSKSSPWDSERDAESSSHTELYAPQPKRPHGPLAVPYRGIADSEMREVDRDAPPRDSFDSVRWDPSSGVGPQGKMTAPLGDAYGPSSPFSDPGNPFGSTVSLPSTVYPSVPPGLLSAQQQQQQQQPPSPSQTPVALPKQSSPGGQSSQAPHSERWHAPATSQDVTLGSLPSPPWDSAPHALGATGSEASASYHTARTGRLSDSTDLPYR
jgi:hypothetical protein